VQVGQVTGLRMVRGPYLQCLSPANIIVRWRTDWFSDSVVRYGTDSGLLGRALTNTSGRVEHEINITGLQDDTTYFYSIGSTSNTFAAGPDFYFHTAPTNVRPVRIWAIGDSGSGMSGAAAVRDGYYQASAGEHTDVWLMLGDNAYINGLDGEYQNAVFDMYSDLLRRTAVWPARGNHDSTHPYVDIFTLPEASGSWRPGVGQ
jgi:acid phosphatase type 7